jgi:hypothetical protein
MVNSKSKKGWQDLKTVSHDKKMNELFLKIELIDKEILHIGKELDKTK